MKQFGKVNNLNVFLALALFGPFSSRHQKLFNLLVFSACPELVFEVGMHSGVSMGTPVSLKKLNNQSIPHWQSQPYVQGVNNVLVFFADG